MCKLLVLVVMQMTPILLFAQPQGWTDDFAAAKAQAASKKSVLVIVDSPRDKSKLKGFAEEVFE